MSDQTAFIAAAAALAMLVPAAAARADAAHDHARSQPDAIVSPSSDAIVAGFDIQAAHVHREGRSLVFHMSVSGQAGRPVPEPIGALAGAPVHAYVWPTSLDPSHVGFESGAGILALAATAHPDFDDTPLFDENADGDPGNDGARWHSHWVVLTPTEACGPGALAVRDIPEGVTPPLPATWPGLPLLIDSPGYTPRFDGGEIIVTTPLLGRGDLAGARYDGVTSALRVNANLHAPLLCVTDVFDIASGDLSLSGTVAGEKNSD